MEVKEGKASIETKEGVFYNPNMRTLRNISVSFLNAASTEIGSLLDCTSATGIRGIRYALECKAKGVVMLDMNESAYDISVGNAGRNGIGAKVLHTSIQEFANTTKAKFDAIDLDPFGTPAPYIFDLMKISKDGTLLMVTATDTAVLCGAHAKACMRIYGAKPMHNELCHEAGLRILIGYIVRDAAQFNFGIEPLLAISDMHYIRVFLRLKKGANSAAESVGKIGFASACSKCHSFSYSVGFVPVIEMRCDFCGSEMVFSGPLWLGKLHDKGVVKRMLSDDGLDRHGFELLERVYQELDLPFFYVVPKITKYLGIGGVPFEKIIRNLGVEASRTHFSAEAIKTSAGIEEVVNAVKKASAKGLL